MLAVQDARKKGYDEALLLNQKGFIAEGSGQNIFIIKNNTIITNNKNASILMGITRDTVIQLCNDLKLNIQITDISEEMLFDADEAFFTGTASEITPISSINDKTIKDGQPGKMTLKLKEKYHNIIYGKDDNYKKWLTPISHEKYSITE